jgi:hypothetical protein
MHMSFSEGKLSLRKSLKNPLHWHFLWVSWRRKRSRAKPWPTKGDTCNQFWNSIKSF